MSHFTSCPVVRRGAKKVVAAFFTVATLISVSSAPACADKATAVGSSASFTPQAFRGAGSSSARFLPVVDPVFGFPMSLQNLTWGNYKDSDTSGNGTMTQSNLTWGNFTSEQPASGSGDS